jgi:hypothetical protein
VSVLIILVLQPPILEMAFRSSSIVVSSKGKKNPKNKTKKQKQNKTKFPKFKCNTVSVSPSACSSSSVVVSSKEEKKKGLETVL